jgi:hypothetical protein
MFDCQQPRVRSGFAQRICEIFRYRQNPRLTIAGLTATAMFTIDRWCASPQTSADDVGASMRLSSKKSSLSLQQGQSLQPSRLNDSAKRICRMSLNLCNLKNPSRRRSRALRAKLLNWRQRLEETSCLLCLDRAAERLRGSPTASRSHPRRTAQSLAAFGWSRNSAGRDFVFMPAKEQSQFKRLSQTRPGSDVAASFFEIDLDRMNRTAEQVA